MGKSGERGSGISVLPARHDDDDDENSSVWLDTQDARSRDRNPSNFM